MKQLLFIPGPVAVAPEVLSATARPMIDHRGPEFAALLGRVAAGMKPIFGTQNNVVLLGSSGTGGLEAAVASLFSPGERVLAAPVGVFGKRLTSIARTWGLEVEEIATEPGACLDPQALRARLAADTAGSIAGILLTHNETSTGVQNDMAAIADAIGDHPACVVVDSVSGLAASPFLMDAWRFDVVVTASQKALAAPPGLAMVAVSERAWTRIAAHPNRRFYFDLSKAREFGSQGQTPWTPPLSILYALDESLARYASEGAANVTARHAAYARAIRNAAAAIGVEVFSRPDAHSVTVVAMKAPAGVDVAALRVSLRERDGVVMGGGQAELKGKIVRMGTMGDLSVDDVLYGIDALDRALADQTARTYTGAARAAAALSLDEAVLTTA
jgi:aspartate aminotransferase-like enzyme